jgi:hypothetical protein
MSWGSIYLLSERSLKVCCLVIGAIFLGISAHLWRQGAIQESEAPFLILIPLVSGIVMLIGAVALKKNALRSLVLAWFVGIPAVFWVVNTVACGANWFSTAWCQ